MHGVVPWLLWIVAVLMPIRSLTAAEIVTECPRINDAGRKLTVQKLLLDNFERRIIDWDSRDLNAPDSRQEYIWTFWRPGMSPIAEIFFSCAYADKSLYHVPIPGWLLSCRAIKRKEDWYTWIASCTSETDPGLLLGK